MYNSSSICINLSGVSKEKGPMSDPEWVHFLEDHRRVLMDMCTIVKPDIRMIYKHKHRPEKLLKHLNVDTEFTSITLWLNNLHDPSVPTTYLHIPDKEKWDITSIQERYREWINKNKD